MNGRPVLQLTNTWQAALIAGARDVLPVRGLTHNFYRYPARFSPAFVRAAIETFTKPGDLVLDNHVGGGTTLVEALACLSTPRDKRASSRSRKDMGLRPLVQPKRAHCTERTAQASMVSRSSQV